MIGALDVLVVDDRPETVRFLTDFLLQRCRRVEVATSAKEAMTALSRRKTSGEGFHLIFSDYSMPGTDGLAFLRELRQRNEEIPFVFITGFASLNPALETEARRLGVLAILGKPVELGEIGRLLDQATTTYRRKRDQQSGDQPFFGTSRILRRSDASAAAPTNRPSEALEPLTPITPWTSTPDEAPRPVSASWQAPSEALEPRLPAALQLQPADPPPQRQPNAGIAVGSSTARLRRGGDPAQPPGTGRVSRYASPQPPTSFTARVRRGIDGTGTFTRQGRGDGGRQIACVGCGRLILVLDKPMAYDALCVHCGQMQRVEPL